MVRATTDTWSPKPRKREKKKKEREQTGEGIEADRTKKKNRFHRMLSFVSTGNKIDENSKRRIQSDAGYVARLSSVKRLWHFYSEHYGFLWNRNFDGLFGSVACTLRENFVRARKLERINFRPDEWAKQAKWKVGTERSYLLTALYVFHVPL